MRNLLAPLALLAVTATTASAQTVLTFDDIFGTGNNFFITDEYASQGVSFASNAVATCANTAARPDCGNVSWGSGAEASAAALRGTEQAAMTWFGATPIINYSAGFSNGFSLFYANPFASAGRSTTVQVWSGLDGTGSLLGDFLLGDTGDGQTTTGCFGAQFCSFASGGIDFAGTAQSVRFTGDFGFVAYDDITFGSSTPGTRVPEPSTFSLFALSLIAIPVSRRLRRSH